MKIIYSDVFIDGLDDSLKGLLCLSTSNGTTFTVNGTNADLPPCSKNKTECVENLTINEISQQEDFISIYGSTDTEPLVIIRVHSLILNRETSELDIEAGIVNFDNTSECLMPGVFKTSAETDMLFLASRINRYLIENDQNLQCRA